MRAILSERLAGFRSWSYAELAGRIDSGFLEHVENTASDSTEYQMEFQAFWDDKPHGNIRVTGSFSAEPQRPLFGFIPIYMPDESDSFILSPDGRFVGEDEKAVA